MFVFVVVLFCFLLLFFVCCFVLGFWVVVFHRLNGPYPLKQSNIAVQVSFKALGGIHDSCVDGNIIMSTTRGCCSEILHQLLINLAGA